MRPPPVGTIERWCYELVSTSSLAHKVEPPDLGDAAWEADAPARRIARPGRPAQLALTGRSERTPSAKTLSGRAQLVHTFLHHELQAAELFAWAILAFPDTPRAFRKGLLGLCREELAHLGLYRRHLERLGFAVGSFGVRDWFWERVAGCENAAAFVALMGLGLEGANLEHSARFAAEFRAAGDEAGAAVLERVGREEIAHVAFAVRWFERWNGAPLDYERWRAALPVPLTPSVLVGANLNREARLRAGLDESFLARLEAEPPSNVRRPS
jgi:uncharacterized ferritin-like protein (DUF455 family)